MAIGWINQQDQVNILSMAGREWIKVDMIDRENLYNLELYEFE
jgi:hypothetical protein